MPITNYNKKNLSNSKIKLFHAAWVFKQFLLSYPLNIITVKDFTHTTNFLRHCNKEPFDFIEAFSFDMKGGRPERKRGEAPNPLRAPSCWLFAPHSDEDPNSPHAFRIVWWKKGFFLCLVDCDCLYGGDNGLNRMVVNFDSEVSNFYLFLLARRATINKFRGFVPRNLLLNSWQYLPTKYKEIVYSVIIWNTCIF